MQRRFAQVDVFTTGPGLGNALAVVLDGDGLSAGEMQRFARWTNLSETAFVVPTDDPDADYAVRIFTPTAELPFAGHPTLGACHAWLAAGGRPREEREIVQACAAGLIRVRRTGPDALAFAEPPLLRGGPVDEPLVARLAASIGLDRDAIVDAQWADNGPGWVVVLLASAEEVLVVEPRAVFCDLGIVGPYPPGSPSALEVRALWPEHRSVVEDPVTGSLNASVAGWLVRSGRLSAPYVATQGGAIGRAGRVEVTQDGDGTLWIGGRSLAMVTGTVDL